MSYPSSIQDCTIHFIKRRYLAFGNAVRGLRFCFKNETHFIVQALIAVVVIGCGLLLGLSKVEWLAIGLCIILVLVLEAVNTAIEHLCNVVSPGYHPGIRIVKDVAAGAVLLAAIGSAIIGLFIFMPKFFFLLKSIG